MLLVDSPTKNVGGLASISFPSGQSLDLHLLPLSKVPYPSENGVFCAGACSVPPVEIVRLCTEKLNIHWDGKKGEKKSADTQE